MFADTVSLINNRALGHDSGGCPPLRLPTDQRIGDHDSLTPSAIAALLTAETLRPSCPLCIRHQFIARYNRGLSGRHLRHGYNYSPSHWPRLRKLPGLHLFERSAVSSRLQPHLLPRLYPHRPQSRRSRRPQPRPALRPAASPDQDCLVAYLAATGQRRCSDRSRSAAQPRCDIHNGL